jgi:flagellar protein FlaI
MIDLDIGGQRHNVVSSSIRRKLDSYVYSISEPVLTREERIALWKAKETLQKSGKKEISGLAELAKDYFSFKGKHNISTTSVQDAHVLYHLYRDLFGHGKLEGLTWSKDISVVSFDRIGFPIEVFHDRFGWLPTNIVIATDNELKQLLKLLKARLVNPKESRSAITGHNRLGELVYIDKNTETFRIRKNAWGHDPVAPLLRAKTINPEALAMLLFFLKNGCSVLVLGHGPARLELVSSLSTLLAELGSRVLTIEKRPELKVLSDNWIPEVLARQKDVSNALRHSPDYVVINGLIGKQLKETLSCLPKQTVLLTMPSPNLGSGFGLLDEAGIDKSTISGFDVIVDVGIEKRDIRHLQRVKEVTEVLGYDPESDELVLNPVFRWAPKADRFIAHKSMLMEKLTKKTSKAPRELITELKGLVKLARSAA